MAGMARYDLHTHSTESDGTEPPAVVVRAAARAGLDGLALTDHDTVAGWEEAMSAGEELGIRVIRGIEVTAKTATGISVHLLAYLPNPESPELTSVLAAARDSRDLRAQRMVELIAADYALDWEDVLAAAGEESTIGRPHIADALIARGHVRTREEAFAGILHGGSPYFVSHASPSRSGSYRMRQLSILRSPWITSARCRPSTRRSSSTTKNIASTSSRPLLPPAPGAGAGAALATPAAAAWFTRSSSVPVAPYSSISSDSSAYAVNRRTPTTDERSEASSRCCSCSSR